VKSLKANQTGLSEEFEAAVKTEKEDSLRYK
jgi:hypothetical protein